MEKERHSKPNDLFLMGEWVVRLLEGLEHNYQWGHIKYCLDRLANFKDRTDLESIGLDAEIHQKELSRKYWEDKQYIETSDREVLKAWLRWSEGRLDELSKRWVLSFPQTHIRVDKLSSGAKSFLKDDEWNALQPLEQEGLNEAASCLLFNNFTSAEFIALRTAESLLRRWYEKRTASKLERARWGEVLEELDKQFPKPNRPKELSLLDYLRGRRNEIAHPEVVSNEEEATATFLNVVRVCKTITSELSD